MLVVEACAVVVAGEVVDDDVGGLVGIVGVAAGVVANALPDEELVSPDRTDEATTAELLTIEAVSAVPVELEFASEESAALAETSGSTVVVDDDEDEDEEVVAGVVDAA